MTEQRKLRYFFPPQLLGAGASIEEILSDYPFLEREDILAALEYAAHQAVHPVLQVS